MQFDKLFTFFFVLNDQMSVLIMMKIEIKFAVQENQYFKWEMFGQFETNMLNISETIDKRQLKAADGQRNTQILILCEKTVHCTSSYAIPWMVMIKTRIQK